MSTPDYCIWALNGDGAYDTSCREEFFFIDAGPIDNGFNHCPYCGKLLEEVKA